LREQPTSTATSTSASTAAIIRYREVSHRYGGGSSLASQADAPALDRVSFEVREGESLGILGPNGGGKSTLLRLTLGLMPLQHGSIEVLGRSPIEAARHRLIGYVPQRQEIEHAAPFTVREVVALAASAVLSPWKSLGSDTHEQIDRVLELTGVRGLADRPIGQISGGQLQRAMIARALALGPRILLLDEPTVGIDPAGQLAFASLLRSLRADLGLTIVIVSHDVRAIAAGCDRVACLSRSLHFHDAPSGLTPAVLAEVFRHDLSGIFGDLHVDAHSAAACSHPDHHHPPPLASSPMTPAPVALSVDAPSRSVPSPEHPR
jgi:zinc transport system ATP-binding protein